MSKLIVIECSEDVTPRLESPLDFIAYGLAIEDHYLPYPAFEIMGSDRYTLDHQHAVNMVIKEMIDLDNEWFENDERWYT